LTPSVQNPEHRPSPTVDAVTGDDQIHTDVAGAAHAAAHDPHNDPEHIRSETRVYLLVFFSLAVLTGVTVGACYWFNLPIHYAIMVALTIASIKGFLVAGFFMHLLSEKKLVYSVLALTVFFFIVLMLLPISSMHSRLGY
jgi:cytochrome c oxidase subunit 4